MQTLWKNKQTKNPRHFYSRQWKNRNFWQAGDLLSISHCKTKPWYRVFIPLFLSWLQKTLETLASSTDTEEEDKQGVISCLCRCETLICLSSSLPGASLFSVPQKASSVSGLVFESCEEFKDVGGCCWVDTSSEYTLGCFEDKCRHRLLTPPLSTSCFMQMRQRTAFRLSKWSKCFQITLRCRGRLTECSSLVSICVIISDGPTCGRTSFKEELIPVVCTAVSSSSPSSATSTEEERDKVTFKWWTFYYMIILSDCSIHIEYGLHP